MEDISDVIMDVDDTAQEDDLTNKQDFSQDSDSCSLIKLKDGSKKELENEVPPASHDVIRRFPCSIKTRQSRYITGIVATSSLGSFLWGYNFSVIAGAVLLIDDHFNLSVLWHEAIVSVLVGGATVGAAIAGTLNDKFGRWKVMMLSAILHVVAAVVMALAFSEVFLVIGRTIAGLAIGLYSVTGPVYVSEMAPSHIRGKLGLVNYFMTGGGVVSASIAAGLFSIDTQHAYTYGWRYMLGLAVVPSLLMCCGLWFLFETPRWLVFHGRLERARKVMETIRNDNMVEEELCDIQKDYELNLKRSTGTCKFITQVLKNKTILHALFIGCSIQTFAVFSGMSIVVSYGPTIYRMVGFSLKEAIWFATLPAFLNLAVKVVSVFFIERVGRRKLFIASGSFLTFFLSLLAVFLFLGNSASPSAVPLTEGGECDYSNCGACVANSHCGFCTVKVNGEYLYGTCSEGNENGDDFNNNNTLCVLLSEPVNLNDTTDMLEWYFDRCPNSKYAVFSLLTIMLIVTSTSAGFTSLPWVINSEIYPTWARGQAASLSSFFKWFTNILTLLTFLSMVDALGLPQVIVMYAVMSFFGVVFVFFLLPETSNQSLEKVEEIFNKPYFLNWCNPHCCKNSVYYSVVEMDQQTDDLEMS